ncbi:MAG: hypothetical protein K2P79_02220 [Sphingomonas sp.]|nr:hypothetical protein [Sphingomonas sp.]
MSFEDQTAFADALGVALILAFFGYLFWAYRARKRQVDGCVPDGPVGEPYRIFTRDHDLALAARDVPAALQERSPDRFKNWMMADPVIWQAQTNLGRQGYAAIDPTGSVAGSLRAALENPADWAVALIIDQSGSMKGNPICAVAASARWFSQTLTGAGVANAVLGFSTVGWHGGKAREDWLWQGARKRPGRLCALLHIVYQDFDSAMTDEDWAVMLHPDILRENVDGEAIEWAASLLEQRQEKHRLLIVMSDGAPVDDATLEHNGPSYLWNHLKQVIAKMEGRSNMRLAAVGVDYRVDGLYKRARSVTDLTAIPNALVELVAETAMPERLGAGSA